MQKHSEEGPDMINTVLEDCIMAFPVSSFIISLYKHYLKWGTLSKKQLQGLHKKAGEIEGIAPGKLAALEVIIKRMPTKQSKALPEAKPMFEKDEKTAKILKELLEKYPSHKQGLMLYSKFLNNQLFTTTEQADLKRFQQLLDKKG
jgi:hypothetical protein